LTSQNEIFSSAIEEKDAINQKLIQNIKELYESNKFLETAVQVSKTFLNIRT
jgi:hypothetical protein